MATVDGERYTLVNYCVLRHQFGELTKVHENLSRGNITIASILQKRLEEHQIYDDTYMPACIVRIKNTVRYRSGTELQV